MQNLCLLDHNNRSTYLSWHAHGPHEWKYITYCSDASETKAVYLNWQHNTYINILRTSTTFRYPCLVSHSTSLIMCQVWKAPECTVRSQTPGSSNGRSNARPRAKVKFQSSQGNKLLHNMLFAGCSEQYFILIQIKHGRKC